MLNKTVSLADIEVKATQMIMKNERHYEEAITSIITIYEATFMFTVGMSLHHGFTLNPYLFTLATDNITKHDQNEVLQYILFVNEVVRMSQRRNQVNDKLELRRKVH